MSSSAKMRARKEDYVLTQVHDGLKKAFTREKNSEAWKKSLSIEDYVMREHVLGLSKMASSCNHELMVFTMTAKDRPEEPLCSCELLVRKGCRYKVKSNDKDADSIKKDVQRQDIMCGCVGAVFTYKEHRGQGLALIMIDHLVAFAKTPQVLGEDGFIFLYSEVGEFYARNGFLSFGVPLTSLPIVRSNEEYVEPENVRLLGFHEFGEVFEAYAKQFEQEMKCKVSTDGIERISVTANEEYVDWFHLRAKYHGLKLFYENLRDWDFADETIDSLGIKFANTSPKYFGLKLTCPDDSLKGFIVWTYDYEYDSRLFKFHNHVTLIKKFVVRGFDEDETMIELFQHMMAYLQANHSEKPMQNLRELKLWESEVSAAFLEYLKREYGAKCGLENPSRSALLIIRDNDDNRLRQGKIIWEENTKLPWF